MPRASASDDEILTAAQRAFVRFGWHGTTLERLAEEAGTSRVTLHRRGITKELVLERLAQRAVEAYQRAVWPALTAAGTAAERLHLALEALCELTDDYQDVIRALDARTNAAVFHEASDESLTRNVFTEPLERLLRDGLQDGTLACEDPSETATVLFNLVAWSYLHLRAEHGWRAQRARSAVLSVALDGVRRS